VGFGRGEKDCSLSPMAFYWSPSQSLYSAVCGLGAVPVPELGSNLSRASVRVFEGDDWACCCWGALSLWVLLFQRALRALLGGASTSFPLCFLIYMYANYVPIISVSVYFSLFLMSCNYTFYYHYFWWFDCLLLYRWFYISWPRQNCKKNRHFSRFSCTWSANYK